MIIQNVDRICRTPIYPNIISVTCMAQKLTSTISFLELSDSVPFSWTGYRSSCYLVINRLTRQWNQARQVCQEHGGDLVEIGSSEENHFVYSLARAKASDKR